MGEAGRFLSNIYDHRKPDAEGKHTYSHHAMFCGLETMKWEWRHHLEWIDRNVIGRPKATEKYTVEELEKMGMIGIYAKLEDGEINE